ncbi:Azurin [Flavobacteriaceae bacterium Ap0902]|nr:Azurin [Flavobacteriaceae bacterium Ap0902]
MKKIILMTTAVFLLSSCGNDNKTVEETTTVPETTAPSIETPTVETTTTGEGQEVTLEIGGTDAMKYTKDELRVPAGSTVTLTFHHEGKMPIETMGHNWVLLKPGTDIPNFAMDAMKEVDNNYLPQDTTKFIAATKMIGGGESTTITFEAPEAGTYDFICTFPGHYGSMHGKFIVE